MNLPGRAAAAYLAASFVLGAVSGGAMGYAYTAASRHRPHQPPARAQIVDHFLGKLSERTHLTEDQRAKIREVANEGFDELKRSDNEHFCKARDIIRANHEKMARFLTPAQVEALRAWDAEREESWQREHRGDGAPPQPPPRAPSAPAPPSP